MPFRDHLRKGEKPDSTDAPTVDEPLQSPTFTFVRSDTTSQEVISPPSFNEYTPYRGRDAGNSDGNDGGKKEERKSRLSIHHLRTRARSTSKGSVSSDGSRDRESRSPSSSSHKRLSERLHLRKPDLTSENVPKDLPEILVGGDDGDKDGKESQWEKRATMLAMENERNRSMPPTPTRELANMNLGAAAGSAPAHVVSTKLADDNIQEAIRLHEEGDLATSTKMFGRLADPNGENNALSQVLYGLALRHGWGCTPDPAAAVTYLSAAASNAASIEELALQAGMKKGGAAKGELVLAIFELANCFRHGWGVKVDPVAAKQYYETAANLGDTDAMNEVAWCYLEGFGCKKDKYAAAKYYRQAEKGGNKTLGNTW
ncbi:putative cell cycle inhibitor [Xylogone sp. PMI_703]|nr:putative cell cycle inhibitor [Xylogone sp. PMI_703]